jgi:hypothetical protein
MPLVIHEQVFAFVRPRHIFHTAYDDAMITAGIGLFKVALE